MELITRTRETIAAEIIEFARVNELQLHPGQTALKWADLVIRKGGVCPCVPGRDHCPCQEASNDIAEIDRCRCGLFVNGAYMDGYNRLHGTKVATPRPIRVEAKARGFLLRKMVINGFSVQEEANRLTLRPRGAEETAAITIEEVEPNVWRVKSASGRYAGFARGSKRLYFETYLRGWVAEALLQAGIPTLPILEAPG